MDTLDALLNVLVLVGILGVSALFTHWFTHWMYRRCPACGALNAQRRANCRRCGAPLR